VRSDRGIYSTVPLTWGPCPLLGLTHLLGFRYAPRLRDLSDSKLYTVGKSIDFPKLETLLRGQINTKIIQENYDDVLRLAHSIREGTVSASLIMGKPGSYERQNSLATALREMGRIEKTIFILDYLSSEALRRKIHRGLNKREAMNALARAIFFGKHGEPCILASCRIVFVYFSARRIRTSCKNWARKCFLVTYS